MLVEINLLPKKDPKSIALLVIIISAVFIMLIAGIFIFWQGTRLNDELKNLNNQISSIQKLVEVEQAKLEKNNLGSESFTQLESAVQWANAEPIKSAPVIKRLVALLPERGFIQTVSYAETGTVTMTVQFDSSRQAAYFYKTLLDADWITGATLSSLATTEPEKVDTEDTTNQEKEQIVPRYTGQFSITLNRDVINSQELAENANKPGGTGS